MTPPDQIALSEQGLNVNYSNSGAYGNGIYFADNAAYSKLMLIKMLMVFGRCFYVM
jgi:hypothetical protein